MRSNLPNMILGIGRRSIEHACSVLGRGERFTYDESSGAIKKCFDSMGGGVHPTACDYRELLFRATEGMSKSISGVILYNETIRQNAKNGTPLVT